MLGVLGDVAPTATAAAKQPTKAEVAKATAAAKKAAAAEKKAGSKAR